jgi:hypothetical protein
VAAGQARRGQHDQGGRDDGAAMRNQEGPSRCGRGARWPVSCWLVAGWSWV